MNNCVENYLQELSKKEIVKLGKQNYLLDKKLSITVAKDGIILPPIDISKKFLCDHNPQNALYGAGGVLDQNHNYIVESAQLAYGLKNRVYGEYPFNYKNIKYRNERIIYMNFFIHQWGHYLVDVVGRLWYALQNDTKTKIGYTCYKGQKDFINGNYLELLKLMGIEEERLILINEPTKFKEVIVPESSIYPGKYYTKEYKQLFDRVVVNANVSKVKSNKIYCSRARLKSVKIKDYGEENLERILNDNGYRSVYMEQISLVEQIKLLNSATSIAMINGSLAHNLLFVRNNARVVIFNKTYRLNLHQFLINQLTNANATFVDAYCSPLPVLYGYGPFLIKTTREFLRYCKDNKISYSYKDINNKLTILERGKYYINWIWSYKKIILKGERICETDIREFEKTLKEIRTYYIQYIHHYKNKDTIYEQI